MNAKYISLFRCPRLIFVSLLLACVTTPAFSQQTVGPQTASCTSASPTTMTLQLPASISVPRDQRPGEVIALTNWVSVDELSRGVCSFQGTTTATPAAAAGYSGRFSLPAPVRTYVENGITYSVYALNGAPGVGAIFSIRPRQRILTPPGCGDIFPERTQQSQFDRMDSTSICTGNVASRYAVGITVRAKLIRYAPIVDGTRINPTVVFDGYPLIRSAGTTQPGSPVLPSNLRVILGATTINVLTCSTRDVQVNMGRVARSDFNGVNGPLRSFAINLNCPANMNKVTVRVDPNTAEIGNQGIVALDAQSSAAGVGVQLLTGSGAAFPLRTAVPVSQYNPAQTGSFDIPLQVRYVQVGGAISAGTANTTMMFTLTYE